MAWGQLGKFFFGIGYVAAVQTETMLWRHAVSSDINSSARVSVFTACKDKSQFKINRKKIQHSNLGGLGPDKREEPSLVFGDVFPRSGRTVDLHITNTTPYHSSTPGKNGIKGEYGTISLDPGRVNLRMHFVDRNTSKTAQVDPFIFSFFDLGHWINGGSEVIVAVSKFLAYKVSDDTSLLTDGYRFKASKWAAMKRDQRQPMNLPPEDLAHSVAFLMPAGGFFVLELKVSEGNHSRNVLFNGMSRLSCPSNPMSATCDTYKCPADYVLKTSAHRHYCLSEVCKPKLGNTRRCCNYAGTPPL